MNRRIAGLEFEPYVAPAQPHVADPQPVVADPPRTVNEARAAAGLDPLKEPRVTLELKPGPVYFTDPFTQATKELDAFYLALGKIIEGGTSDLADRVVARFLKKLDP
jgi:hypothetical protein